jgi:CheY-like chemotaxis protein
LKSLGAVFSVSRFARRATLLEALRRLRDGVPEASAVETVPPAEAGDGPALGGRAVLVVDDNAVNLTVATTLLAREGAVAVGAESGAEALERAAADRFDLILMDLEMPGMSGIEAARHLREPGSGAERVPIVALTAHAFPEQREMVSEAGMNDFLAKPYKPEQLYAVIAKWLGGGGEPRPGVEPEVPAAAAELPLYDGEAALAIVGGNEEVARLVLEKFLDVLPDNEAAIRAAHAAADYPALYQAIHRLAGAAGSGAATAIHAEADRLQKQLKLEPVPVEAVDAGVVAVLAQTARFRERFSV